MNSQALKKRVFVGLSGGVDSAVSAVLLKHDGCDVTGVFIKVWQPDWINCTWKEERREAMRVAAYLGIPFITLDLTTEYKKDVVDYMIREYSSGRTPNPDVMCNRYVKFGGFWKWAKANGGTHIATGHYAKIQNNDSQFSSSNLAVNLGDKTNSKREETLKYSLLAGADANKDQSYFLWTLNQKDLPHVIFPIGHLTKPEVRKLAKKFGLPNADKKDSQGLCFIGKVDVKDFLSHYVKAETGKVLNEHGETVGSHPGALFFTNGERHGFIITEKTPSDAPFYVIDKDVEQNTITVSNRQGGDNLQGNSIEIKVKTVTNTEVRITNVNWIGGEIPQVHNLQARSRYRQPLGNIKIVQAGIAETILEFEKPQDALSPGQSLVIYDGEVCLGGGIIE